MKLQFTMRDLLWLSAVAMLLLCLWSECRNANLMAETVTLNAALRDEIHRSRNDWNELTRKNSTLKMEIHRLKMGPIIPQE
jgi:hypothetical protein